MRIHVEGLVDYHLSQPRSGNLYRWGFDTDLVEVGSELRDHWDLDAGGYIGEPHSQTHHPFGADPPSLMGRSKLTKWCSEFHSLSVSRIP